MLTVQILANHDELLDEVLRSIEPLGAQIQVVPRLAEPHDIFRNRYASIAKHDWLLWLEPWEVLSQGHDTILYSLTLPESAYKVHVVQKTLVSKEIRLWNRKTVSFINPVYETLACSVSPLLQDVVILSHKTQQGYTSDLEGLERWVAACPLSPEPRYYRALSLLSQGKYQEFVVAAQEFLFRNSEGATAAMTHYYLGTVYLRVFGDVRMAISEAVKCLVAHPTLAEFWCLAGDALYQGGQYERAKAIYENAIIIGARRIHDDELPIDIDKYKAHPERMIASCKEMTGFNLPGQVR